MLGSRVSHAVLLGPLMLLLQSFLLQLLLQLANTESTRLGSDDLMPFGMSC